LLKLKAENGAFTFVDAPFLSPLRCCATTSRRWNRRILAALALVTSLGLLTWSDAGALERAVTSASSFYRATFAVDTKANDRPQRVELRVNRQNVTVRTSPTIRLEQGARPVPNK